jgi:hypothetical protein
VPLSTPSEIEGLEGNEESVEEQSYSIPSHVVAVAPVRAGPECGEQSRDNLFSDTSQDSISNSSSFPSDELRVSKVGNGQCETRSVSILLEAFENRSDNVPVQKCVDKDASVDNSSVDGNSMDTDTHGHDEGQRPGRLQPSTTCECKRMGRRIIDLRYDQLYDAEGNAVFCCECGEYYRFH